MKTKGLLWHGHHNKLCEWSDNIQERIDYIKKYKPKDEINERLKLLKPITGKLPKEFVDACKAWDKANKAWDKAYKAYKANKAWDKAWEKYKNEIEALHKKECPNCPWNGKTIFPKKEAI